MEQQEITLSEANARADAITEDLLKAVAETLPEFVSDEGLKAYVAQKLQASYNDPRHRFKIKTLVLQILSKRYVFVNDSDHLSTEHMAGN